jgi:hypothetical protein
MDQAKSGLIRKLFIKGRGAEIENDRSVPYPVRTSRVLISNSAHRLCQRPFLLHSAVSYNARTKIEAVSNGTMKFLNTDFVFICSGAMTLRFVGNCAIMPVCRLKTAR